MGSGAADTLNALIASTKSVYEDLNLYRCKDVSYANVSLDRFAAVSKKFDMLKSQVTAISRAHAELIEDFVSKTGAIVV